MKNDIKDFVEQQVVKVLPPKQREKFILIAKMCDKVGNAAFYLNAQELHLEFFQKDPITTQLITLQEVETFLDNDLIISYFTKALIKSKNVELRKMIAFVDKTGLDQKSIKTLDALVKFMQEQETNGGLTYISYFAPTRYSQEKSIKIVQDIMEKE